MHQKLKELEAKFGGAQTSAEVDNSLTRLTKEVEALEKIACEFRGLFEKNSL